jgi:hypothetical protein
MTTTTSPDPWAQPGFIYLYHFRHRLGGNGSHGAAHYCGFVIGTDPAAILERQERHRRGGGARIMAAAYAQGCEPVLVAVKIGSRHEERRLKRMGHFAERLCPICRKQEATATATLPVATPINLNQGGSNQ